MSPSNRVRAVLTVALLFFSLLLPHVQGQEGDFFVHNYHPEEYKGSPQVFMSAEDGDGLVYFASNEGVLIFDGSRWQQITLPNRSRINHLASLDPGRIFVCATAEFGQLVSGPDREITYQSFKHRLPEPERDFQEVIHCYALPDQRYFITRDRIFCMGDRDQSILSVTPIGGVRIGNDVFIIQKDKPGFFSLHPDGLRPVPKSDGLGTITALAQYNEKEILIKTATDLLRFTPSRSPQPDEPFSSAVGGILDRLKDPSIYYQRLTDKLFTIGADRQPIQLVDRDGQVLNLIGKKYGLLSDEIHHIRLDRTGNLWISQNRGISYVQLSSPLTRFAEGRGLESSALAVITHQGTIYAATFAGIHYKTRDMHTFAKIANTSSACFFFYIDSAQRLLASDGNRLLQIIGNQAKELFLADEFIYIAAESPKSPGQLYLGTDSGLLALHYPAAGSKDPVRLLHRFEGIKHAVRGILSDPQDDLWLTLEYQGLARLLLSDQNPDNPGLVQMIDTPPFNKPEDVFLTIHQDSLFASSSAGYFQFRAPGSPPYDIQPIELGKPFIREHEKRIIHDASGAYLWLYGDQQLLQYRRNEAGIFEENRSAFTKIDSAAIESVYTAPDGCSWICTSNGLFRFDPQKKKDYLQPFATRIRRVADTKGQPLFLGLSKLLPSTEQAVAGDTGVVLPYLDQALHFEFTALFYEHSNRTQYQSMLVGFDRQWSNWTSSDHREYTNLPHGHFVFKVRARNVFGTIGSTDSFSFTIKTPWFLTIWAFIVYLVLAFFLLRLVLFLYTHRLEKQKLVLEEAVRARTGEVEEQKRQIAEKNRILNDLATTDDLTGIANHRKIMEYFRSEWHRALREKMPLAVLLADVDNFKAYNDHFGHIQGDSCLQKVAQAFQDSALRPADMAGRYGGEEFLMILPQTNAQGALRVAENVRMAVRGLGMPQQEGIDSEVVTISIGVVSIIPRTEMNPQLLLILADQALYRSKGTGKDRVTLAEQYPGNQAENSGIDLGQQ